MRQSTKPRTESARVLGRKKGYLQKYVSNKLHIKTLESMGQRGQNSLKKYLLHDYIIGLF